MKKSILYFITSMLLLGGCSQKNSSPSTSNGPVDYRGEVKEVDENLVYIDLKGEFGITRDFTYPGRTKKEIDDAFINVFREEKK